MNDQNLLKGMAAALLTTTVAVPGVGQAAGRMTTAQANALFLQCQTAANNTASDFRLPTGIPSTKMWCGVVNREGKTVLIKATDTGESPAASMATDAWRASIEIALAKAYTAASLSSDENALTSEAIGVASQPGAPLWGIGNTNPYRTLNGAPSLSDDGLNLNHHGIVTFGGGVPVYNCQVAQGLGPLPASAYGLIGALGVSGDSVTNDVQVATNAITAAGFSTEPCKSID